MFIPASALTTAIFDAERRKRAEKQHRFSLMHRRLCQRAGSQSLSK